MENGFLFVEVDEKDWYELAQHRWHARKDGNTFYAVRRRQRPHSDTEFITMHRAIAEKMNILTAERPEVDHIDRNGLNNKRENLRAASRTENRNNDNARGFTFDSRNKARPFKVQTGGKAGRYVGRFATQEEAREAYLAEKERVKEL